MELDESFHNAPPRFITITLPNVIMNLLVNPKNFNPLLFFRNGFIFISGVA